MDREQFDMHFCKAIDQVIADMADNSNIGLNKFYAATCFMENLIFLSPVLHAMVEKKQRELPKSGEE